MLHTEVVFLWNNNLVFNPKIIILWVSLTIVQYNTILSKKAQKYIEVIINYIIAVTLHARRNNLMSFCSYSCQLNHGWYYLHHEFILDWLFVHSWTQTLCSKQGESDLHCPWFSSCHDDSPQFSSVKAGRQQTWVRWKERCFGFECSIYDWAEQFFIAELHCLSR